MALQIRRGLEADLPASPADGELLYATDTNKLYVGDGGTAQEISGGTGGGLANIVEDTTPQLGGDLDINGYKIVSTSNSNIEIEPDGTGDIIFHGNLTIDSLGNFNKTGNLNFSPTGLASFGNNATLADGNVYITRNSYSNLLGSGFTFAQHHETTDSVNFTFLRTRGNGITRTSVVNNDDIADITFVGHDGTNAVGTGSITCSVDGSVNLGIIPGRFRFSLHDGITSGANGLRDVAELSSNGIWKVNNISAFNSNSDLNIDSDGTGKVVINSSFEINQAGNIEKTGELNITPTTFTSFGNNTTLADGNVYITRNSYSTALAQGFTFAQHHETADAVNFTFFRTRGTGPVPTAVVNGDDVADLAFAAHNGTASVATGAISAVVDGVPAGGQVPMKFQFLTNNGTAIAARAELSAAGIWKVNSIQNFSGTDLTLTATTVNIAGNVQINAQSDLRFADADSTNYVAFQAPATVSSNITWTLPSADGSPGQVLSTSGNGTLSWATAGSGSGLASRTEVSETTGILENGATEDIAITGAKGYVLYKIETSVAAWVRIYTTSAARTADSSRAEGVDPLPGAGVIAEVITTGAATIVMSPGVIGFNDEALATSAIALSVTNKSGSSSVVTVTLTILQIEA